MTDSTHTEREAWEQALRGFLTERQESAALPLPPVALRARIRRLRRGRRPQISYAK